MSIQAGVGAVFLWKDNS